MASDGVVRQCRRVCGLSGDLAVRNQSQLDQSLESVADAECKAVPLIKELLYRFLDLRVLECGREELGGAVRLVSGAESAREHDHLGLADGLLKFFHG